MSSVPVYEDHRHVTTVVFKHKWEAFLFHTLINRSLFHLGTRKY